MTSMQDPWHHLGQSVSPTKNPANAERGPHMATTDGT